MRATLVYAAAALATAQCAHAWGAAGHQIVATIAQMHLHPDVLPVLCDILHPTLLNTSTAYPPCHLAPIAAWADSVRMQSAYRHTATWHYVGARDDDPGASCVFPGDRGWAGRRDANVLAALGNQTRLVVDFLNGEPELGLAEAADALKFLVHFAGDMHMPLHLTGRERGGNGAKVTFDGRMTNLHSVWDSFLIAQALRSIPSNYSHPMLGPLEAHLRGTIYDGYVRRLMIEGFGMTTGGENEDAVVLRGGRFHDVPSWLECPADEGDSRILESWPVLQTVLRGMGRVLGLEGKLVQRRRSRFGRGARRADGLWNWFWTGATRVDEERWDDDVLCPYAWARGIHELNCALPVWPAELNLAVKEVPASEHRCDHGDLDGEAGATGRRPLPHPDLLELDTPEYAGRVREGWVVERLLAMAGIRLAGILNGLVLGEVGVSLDE